MRHSYCNSALLCSLVRSLAPSVLFCSINFFYFPLHFFFVTNNLLMTQVFFFSNDKKSFRLLFFSAPVIISTINFYFFFSLSLPLLPQLNHKKKVSFFFVYLKHARTWVEKNKTQYTPTLSFSNLLLRYQINKYFNDIGREIKQSREFTTARQRSRQRERKRQLWLRGVLLYLSTC